MVSYIWHFSQQVLNSKLEFVVPTDIWCYHGNNEVRTLIKVVLEHPPPPPPLKIYLHARFEWVSKIFISHFVWFLQRSVLNVIGDYLLKHSIYTLAEMRKLFSMGVISITEKTVPQRSLSTHGHPKIQFGEYLWFGRSRISDSKLLTLDTDFSVSFSTFSQRQIIFVNQQQLVNQFGRP